MGLSTSLEGRSWTTHSSSGPCESIHMLPVFRLPEVSETYTSSFVRRLPRQETGREREYRLKEAEEIANMKAALGLTDQELKALEDELLPSKSREGQKRAVTERVLHSRDSNSLDPSKHTCESSCGPDTFETKGAISLCSSTSAVAGKRQRQYAYSRSGGQNGSRVRLGRRVEVRLRDRKNASTTLDSLGLDLPTPRVLQRAPHSAAGGELALLTAHALWCTRAGKRERPWNLISCNESGFTGGCTLSAKVNTDQLFAAAVDMGLVNLLELRRALGRSVGQVKLEIM